MYNLEIEKVVAEARKALRCLYIAVDEDVARDVNYKVDEVIILLRSAMVVRDRALRGMLEFAKDIQGELHIAALHGFTGTNPRRLANQARLEAATKALAAPLLNPSAWLIHYDDADARPEIFTGPGAEAGARARFAVALQQWNCQLFEMVDDGKRIGTGPELPPIDDHR